MSLKAHVVIILLNSCLKDIETGLLVTHEPVEVQDFNHLLIIL